MTGVGGRPEVVVFGSDDKRNWKEYEFLYKPGALNRKPPIVGEFRSILLETKYNICFYSRK